MKILLAGHSMAHIRQIKFGQALAMQGQDVLLVAPKTWGTGDTALHPEATKITYQTGVESTFELFPLPTAFAGQYNDMYRFTLVGLEKVMQQYRPDLVYVQQEIGCQLTRQALEEAKRLGIKTAIFVWENLHPIGNEALMDQLQKFDLLICGNDAAAALHPHRRQILLPQVGVDTYHFAARPEIERAFNVGYIGRPAPEKGIHDLEAAWPTARITPWMDWIKLPWALSGIKVVVCPSRDTSVWHEQAGPYAAWEAAACGCAVVVSDAGSIRWWNSGGYCEPSPFVFSHQGDPTSLRTAIQEALDTWEARGQAGRAWVEQNLGSPTIAKRLIQAFSTI